MSWFYDAKGKQGRSVFECWECGTQLCVVCWNCPNPKCKNYKGCNCYQDAGKSAYEYGKKNKS